MPPRTRVADAGVNTTPLEPSGGVFLERKDPLERVGSAIVRAAAVAGRGETAVGVGRDRDEERGRRRPGGVARPASKSAVLGLEATVLALEGEGAAEERLHVDR